MNSFDRRPTRYDIPTLRLVQDRQQLRAEALERFNAEERRITTRIRRVIDGARETVRVAWHQWGL